MDFWGRTVSSLGPNANQREDFLDNGFHTCWISTRHVDWMIAAFCLNFLLTLTAGYLITCVVEASILLYVFERLHLAHVCV